MTSSAHIDDVKALHISGPVLQRQDGGELPVGGHAGGHVGSMTRAVPLRPVSCEGQPS